MGKLELQQMVLGPVYTNCYFLKNKETGEALIVDPADSPKRIFQKVEDMGAKPVGILLTHRQEEEMLREPSVNMTDRMHKPCSVRPDIFLEDMQVFEAAGFSIQMLHTPGHTKGSCCYYLKDERVLFSGDTLFCGSVGRTDFPGGSSREIRESLHKLLNALPDETNVYPGHDTSTTIGYEKRYNPFV